MTITAGSARLTFGGLSAGSHVCWVVGDQAAYIDAAAALLSEARAAGQKPMAFGHEGSDVLAALEPAAAITADPHVAFLDRGPLEPEVMLAMFREQAALARTEGYDGLRVVADMDWLLAGRPTDEAIVGFELLLDRVVAELEATVVCAYRRSSFSTDAIAGALAVHPVDVGHDEEPQFRLVAGGHGIWRLSGQIDVAVSSSFAAAFNAAAAPGNCLVDVSDLEFIDVAGMRVIARMGVLRDVRVRLLGASPALRRGWVLAGFDELAPTVGFVA
jgi:anti-anti-sigma factor